MSIPTEPPSLQPLAATEQVAATQRALRIPAIAADLLPLEVVDARRGRRVRRVMLVALAAFTAVLAAWYVLTTYQTAQARDALTGAQDNGQALLRQQRQFAEVVSIQAQSRAISDQLAVLMATDLRWARLLGAVEGAKPAWVQLTSISAALTPVSSQVGAAAVTLPNTAGKELVGTLTVTGIAMAKPYVADYADALGRLGGAGNPLVGSATVKDGRLEFSIKLDITAAALGGRYSTATATPTASGGTASGGTGSGGTGGN